MPIKKNQVQPASVGHYCMCHLPVATFGGVAGQDVGEHGLATQTAGPCAEGLPVINLPVATFAG